MPQRVEVPGMGVVEFPDGMSDDQIIAAIKANAPKPPSRADLWKREAMALASPLRGVKDVIDTGAEFLSRLGGKDEAARVKAMNDAGNADFDRQTAGSWVAPVGRLIGQAVGTAPALSAAGAGAAAAGLPRFGSAIASGGMKTGAAPVGFLGKSADMGIRALGGGVSGGIGAGMIDPGDAGVGAAIGGALPVAAQLAGKVAGAVGGALRGPQASAVRGLADALGQDPKALAQALRAAEELVPGSEPTVAQALRTPQAGILERVVSDSKGSVRLKERYPAQNAARLRALDAVAPVDPRGFRSAQYDTGAAIDGLARNGDAAARARTRGLYESVPQDEATLYLPDLAATRDRFFGAGSFVDREPADLAVQTAQQLTAPARPALSAGTPQTLASAVRKAGGIKAAGDLAGEARAIDAKGMLRRNGQTLDEMAESMHQRGLIGEESPDALIDALRTEAMGGRGLAGERAWQAGRDAAMGEPGARRVTLREFDDLRESIGIVQRKAKRDNNSKLSAALGAMKDKLDDRLDEVVRGDGAIDENIPIAWANALDAARKSKVEQVQRFRTGPQASIFRQGADGQPLVQGGEVAAKFWGNRPGAADDVRSLRRLIDDDPALLGQFRSMITTEGAGTATQAGNLTGKFARWVDNARPGLGAAFEPQQTAALDRIAQDIMRAEQGAAAGMARGSNTYQNAQNALSLGLLDSKLANVAAARVPVLGHGVDWLRETARDARARRLDSLLADPKAAAAALDSLSDPALRGLLDPLVLGLARGAPVLAADR